MNVIEQAINDDSSESKVTSIGKFSVDGQEYTIIGDYSFIWEKSYVKSPSRAISGSMGPLDTLSTFLTPHMTVTFDQMPINDYRRLVKQSISKNEFLVKCYDPINNIETTNKMYFATMASPKFIMRTEKDENGQNYVRIISVQNFTVELIGTNNE